MGTGPLTVEDVVRLTREMRESGVSAFKALGVEVEFSPVAQVRAAKDAEGIGPDDVIDDDLLFHSADQVVKPEAKQ